MNYILLRADLSGHLLCSCKEMAEDYAIDRDGWHLAGEDQEAVSKVVVEIYTQSRVSEIGEVIAKCNKWQML
jgi:hypothetical protein